MLGNLFLGQRESNSRSFLLLIFRKVPQKINCQNRFVCFGEMSKCGVLPYCTGTPIVYNISTPIVDFSNSATAGPKPGIKIA